MTNISFPLQAARRLLAVIRGYRDVAPAAFGLFAR